MERYTIDPNGPWELYSNWRHVGGTNGTVLGTITRATGECGALVQMPTGIYVQLNAGIIRTLDQRAVRAGVLCAIRRRHRLTQAQAAALYGVHHITYAKWERGSLAIQGPAWHLALLLQTAQGWRVAAKVLQIRQVGPTSKTERAGL